MGKITLICITLCFFNWGMSQKKISPLPRVLKESSALIKLDSIFISINDSENLPSVYFFNSDGEIIHTCAIKNAVNYDWETLSFDGDFLYIGDIGNNLNNRKNLSFYKVKIDTVLHNDSAFAQQFRFSYPDQYLFPPKKKNCYFDAEASVIINDTLFVITKNRTSPYDGIAKVYAVTENGTFLIEVISLSSTHWLMSSVTDASYFNNTLFLLTYSKVILLKRNEGTWTVQRTIPFSSITQKEGIAVDHDFIYLTDERESKGEKNFLYQLKY